VDLNHIGTNPMSRVSVGSSLALRGLLRLALPAVTITLALAIEVSVLPRLRLPDAGPDLVLLVVLGFAVAWGAAGGAGVGFAAGLALDLAPPSVGAIGRHAFVLSCVGALAGRAAREVRTSALRTCLLAGVYAGAAVLGDALLGTLIGDGTGLGRPGLAVAAGAAAIYTVVATPLVVPGIAALARKTASPGARVLAPAGNALGGPVHGGGGAFGGRALGSVVVFGGAAPVPAHGNLTTSDLTTGDLTTGDVKLLDLTSPDQTSQTQRGARRAFQHPEAG
jgi:rod shape-determining protein MreD